MNLTLPWPPANLHASIAGAVEALQQANGQTVEFQAPMDVLHDKKVGDRLEINKRLPDGCK